jgi:outer membrane lipoprotein SlyB
MQLSLPTTTRLLLESYPMFDTRTFTASVLIVTLTLIALTGCAITPRGASYVPVVDMQNKSPVVFGYDVADCQAYARQGADAAAAAAGGALALALLGAALAPRGYRSQLAGQGALIGGVAGAGAATGNQETIVRRCLQGRGYNVLSWYRRKNMLIWKWTLDVTDLQTVDMPNGAQVLSVQLQYDRPQLWAMVDETASVEPRTFATYSTGHLIPAFVNYGKFVGTYQMHGGSAVFHVFEQDAY